MAADEGGNGKDLSAERAQLRRRLAELDAKDRLEVLLREPNAAELVRSLPAEDLYAALVDVGLADSTELVQLASPEQFRTFVDLGAWAKDCFDAHRAITWLRAARGDELREFLGKVHELDLEVLQLLLRGATDLTPASSPFLNNIRRRDRHDAVLRRGRGIQVELHDFHLARSSRRRSP